MKRDKIIYILLILCALIGFASGWNYEKLIHENVYDCASGCFELGLFALFLGKTAAKCAGECFLSTVKNLLLFCIGFISWIVFPVTVFNLFSLSFKLGIVFRVSVGYLKFRGIFSTAAIGIITFSAMALSVILTKKIADFRIYHSRKRSLDTSDIALFRSILFFGAIFFVFILLVILCLCKSELHGFFNTFL